MPKKLVVCFDGTWNKPGDPGDGKDTETNVFRLYESLVGTPAAQWDGGKLPAGTTLKWYDSGVGSKWYEHIRGGAFGYGLSFNIRQGYKFLVDNYDDGDEIYIYGFSRGAYTARSLVGMIRNSGLLDRNLILQHLPEGQEKYPTWQRPSPEEFRKLEPDAVPHIMDAYQLYRNRDGGADTDFANAFRASYAHKEVKIKLLGVWDTVGALGIPFKVFESFNAEQYKFHDQELSGIVEHAYHALAIDEHRENFDVTIWNPKQKVNQVMEQVWFVGAHADVGGGYPGEHPIADATLSWMQQKSRLTEGRGKARGLTFTAIPKVDPEKLKAVRPTDSYREFMGGMYRIIKDRHYRSLGSTQYGNESCSEICTQISGYSPKNPGYMVIIKGTIPTG